MNIITIRIIVGIVGFIVSAVIGFIVTELIMIRKWKYVSDEYYQIEQIISAACDGCKENSESHEQLLDLFKMNERIDEMRFK